MTPLNPAPRPLAVQDKVIDLSVNTALISVERPRYPYDTFKVWLQHQGHMFCVYEGHTDVEFGCREWNDKIHKALHPPLCLKHALEIGYPFRVDGDYMVTTKSYGSQQVKGHELVASLAKVKGENISLGSFYPFKDHPLNPTHGEAEAVVNAWKEGE